MNCDTCRYRNKNIPNTCELCTSLDGEEFCMYQPLVNYEKVSNLLVEYFIRSQDAQCLLCDNHIKNITIQKKGSQGCDGNCRWNKEYTKDDLLELFINESKESRIGGLFIKI